MHLKAFLELLRNCPRNSRKDFTGEFVRYFFYSHDGLGLGHTRRNLAIAEAIGEITPDSAILLATGIDDYKQFGIPPGVDVLKMPGLRKVANEMYASRRLRISRSEILKIRSDLLLAAIDSFRPDVLVVDKHPFGAGGELRGALLSHRKRGGRSVLGLRDILDHPDTVRSEWLHLPEPITDLYDEVFIYGQREIFHAVREYGFPSSLAQKTRYCGYVLNRTRKEFRRKDDPEPFLEQRGRPVVLATPGGGEDGSELLETFVRAARGAPWRAVIVTGPVRTGAHDVLRQHAEQADVGFRSFIPSLQNWFGKMDAIVSMGGYNTLAEIVFSGTPSICVPRCVPRIEQLLRARAFERLGLLRCIDPRECAPEALREAIESALAAGRGRTQDVMKFDGAKRAAEALTMLAAAGPQAVSALDTTID
jgi:predicted glycosyltransferase